MFGKASDPVRGYLYEPIDANDPRTRTVCKILDRASENEATDTELREYGPAFRVEFGDGEVMVAYSSELRPWYAT